MRAPNPPGWTKAVGLDGAHDSARATALAQLRSGRDRCPRCRRPMWSWQALDLGDWPSRVIAARYGVIPRKRLEHASCNRSAGARLGNAMRAAGIPGWQRPRHWSRPAATARATRAARW
jgi:hypothetical protein